MKDKSPSFHSYFLSKKKKSTLNNPFDNYVKIGLLSKLRFYNYWTSLNPSRINFKRVKMPEMQVIGKISGTFDVGSKSKRVTK